MRCLIHISDVHFGRDDPKLVAGLLRSVESLAPDVIVVSGDLTQRARRSQFRAAREFLSEFPPVPTIVVPGNHDYSTTNLVERVTRPLARYKRFITRDLAPFFHDEELAIAGINTVRVLSRKDGRINRSDAEAACASLSLALPTAIRVVVTHHPMDLPMDDDRHALIARAPMAMKLFAACKVDLFLSGHLHAAGTLVTRTRYGIAGHSAVVVQAGTAVSTRTRGEPNGYNIIFTSADEMRIQRMIWSKKKFVAGSTERYRRSAGEWSPEVSAASDYA